MLRKLCGYESARVMPCTSRYCTSRGACSPSRDPGSRTRGGMKLIHPSTIHHLQLAWIPACMPSDQGGAIFIDVSLGQRDEPGQMQVSHQQAHHSAGNTWEKGLIYVAPTCQSTERIVPAYDDKLMELGLQRKKSCLAVSILYMYWHSAVMAQGTLRSTRTG